MGDIDVKERPHAHEEHKRKRHIGTHTPGKPWEVEVDVYLDDVGPPPELKPKFHLNTCLPIDPYGNIIFYNCGRPGFTIRFNLFDNTNGGAGSKYAFPNPPGPPGQPDPSKWALWSTKGSGCPPNNCNAQWADFQSDHVEQEGQVLVVTDVNSTMALFGYTLRVTNDRGSTFVNLDPGGSNQNGSTGFE